MSPNIQNSAHSHYNGLVQIVLLMLHCQGTFSSRALTAANAVECVGFHSGANLAVCFCVNEMCLETTCNIFVIILEKSLTTNES